MSTPINEPTRVLTVTALTEELKMLIEEQFDWVDVRGEVSQPKVSRNGHLYFTLKDAGAQLPCVMWSSRRMMLDNPPEHGDEIIVSGPLQIYAPHGRYQMIAQSVRPAGLGALQQAFEKLKRKLEAEGLFDPDRKRKLPRYPEVIGIITSATGAAFQDMRNTLEKRYPLCEVRLYHASVQGIQAAPEITEGIRHLAAQPDLDLLIVGRGGGSLEDLWAFNEESVARAIADCPVPVISAVGHETDFSISDFVADARAATPTQAIIMAVPDRNDLLMKLEDFRAGLENQITDRLKSHKETVSRFLDNYALHKVKQRLAHNREQLSWQRDQLNRLLRNRLQYRREQTDRQKEQLPRLLKLRLQQQREKIRQVSDTLVNVTDRRIMQLKAHHNELHHRLLAVDPNAPLKKGYTRVYQDDQWIRSGDRFREDAPFEIEWSDHRTSLKP